MRRREGLLPAMLPAEPGRPTQMRTFCGCLFQVRFHSIRAVRVVMRFAGLSVRSRLDDVKAVTCIASVALQYCNRPWLIYTSRSIGISRMPAICCSNLVDEPG